MKHLNTLALALICAIPFAASAQTPSGMDKAPPSVKPANTPTTEMERKSGTDTSAMKPGSDTMSNDSMDKSKMKNKKMKKGGTADATTPGDVTTYPAKTRDGRATSEMKSDTTKGQ